MKICSWDVGIYNLSYCILEQDDISKEIKILKWDIVNLVDNDAQKKNRTLLFKNIPIKLNQIPELLEVDYVYIENQPVLKNPQMKSIQMILYSYFLFYGITDGIIIQKTNVNGTTNVVEEYNHKVKTVDFCSASNKLKVYDGPQIALEDLKKKKVSTKPKKSKSKKGKEEEVDYNYELDALDSEDEDYEEKYALLMAERLQKSEKDNKNQDIIIDTDGIDKTVIDATTQHGGSSLAYGDKKKLAIAHATYFLKDQEPKYMEFFNSHKKKDDLADSFLQGVYVLKRVLNKPEKKSRGKTKKEE
jgi:hypothetical protein